MQLGGPRGLLQSPGLFLSFALTAACLLQYPSWAVHRQAPAQLSSGHEAIRAGLSRMRLSPGWRSLAIRRPPRRGQTWKLSPIVETSGGRWQEDKQTWQERG
jgi:hypothetical protein